MPTVNAPATTTPRQPVQPAAGATPATLPLAVYRTTMRTAALDVAALRSAALLMSRRAAKAAKRGDAAEQARCYSTATRLARLADDLDTLTTAHEGA